MKMMKGRVIMMEMKALRNTKKILKKKNLMMNRN